MPESGSDTESTPSPYISLEEDRTNVDRLKPDVAHQLYDDIRRKAKREGLEIKPDDSLEESKRKDRAVKELFKTTDADNLPDYQAAQIVDFEEKATRDPLTGLLNRREFSRLFSEFLQQANESGQPILFLMIDLDHFKDINDNYGHPIGDRALQYLARALASSVEIGDLVARWGGEEFVIAIKPKTGQPLDPDKMLAAAERIRRQIVYLLSKDIYQLMVDDVEQESHIPITLSVGVTLTKFDDTLEIVCQRADGNLYKAKNNGRNQSIGDNGKITLISPPDVPPEIVSS